MNGPEQQGDILQPPKAPEIDRRFHLRRWQWIGIPLLLLVPVLAVIGFFGETRATAHARTSELAIQVEYPTRYRYKMINSLRLNVTNTSPGQLDTVTGLLDTSYPARFSTVVAIPPFEHPYSIPIVGLKPDEVRRVRVELQGEHYGRHTGELRITAGGADTAVIKLSTFIFP